MNTIVVYQSQYGSTEQYAKWIAQALNCPAEKLKNVSRQKLSGYQTVIYGGGLYASGINGFKKFLAKLDPAAQKTLALFMVGTTNPQQKEIYEQVAKRNIPAAWEGKFQVFALRGDQAFSRMSGLHKMMMRVPKMMIEKKPEQERSEEERQFLECFGKDIAFVSEEQIAPILDFMKSAEHS